MKKLICFLMALVAMLSLLMVSTTQVVASATTITTCGLQTDYGEIPGKVWLSDDGTILHIRRQTNYSHVTPLDGHPECDPRFSNAELEMEVNLDLNLVTGVGNTYGKVKIYPDGIDGTWQGMYVGQIRSFVMNGKSVTHGSGELDGMLNKVNIQQIGSDKYEFFGYILDSQEE